MVKRPYGTGSIYRRGNVWWVQYFRQGKLYSESSESRDRAEAQRLLHQRLGEIATDRFQGLPSRGVTISQLCDLVIEDYKFKKQRTLKDVEWRSEKHLRGAVGAIKAADFGSAQIKKYLSGRRAEGAEDATINREMAIIRRGFSIATKEADPPLLALRPVHSEVAGRQCAPGLFGAQRIPAGVNALPDHLRAIFVVAYHASVRLGELCKIQRPQIDLAAGEKRAPDDSDLR